MQAQQTVTDGSRPNSFYDNCETKEPQPGHSPTQVHCLVTTVPQNITSQTLAKKHTPNRNSLRHSRIIAAINNNGQVPRKYLPAIIRYHKLAKALLGLLVLLGLAICFLSLWLLVWAPNLRQRDNPHWSGIPVLISGVTGLVLLCCFRKEHPAVGSNYFVYSVKVLSISLSLLGAVLTFTASAFAIIHLVELYLSKCGPPVPLSTSCLCNMTSTPTQSYHYIDLSCVEVDNILTILLLFSAATNLITGALEAWYVYLHWASRYVYVYSKVRTSEERPTVLSNLRP